MTYRFKVKREISFTDHHKLRIWRKRCLQRHTFTVVVTLWVKMVIVTVQHSHGDIIYRLLPQRNAAPHP